MNIPVNILFPVIPPYTLGLLVFPSLHHVNVHHVDAIACTAVPVPRYVMNCVAVPLSIPLPLVVNVNVYVLIVNNAVNVLVPVTTSALVAPV